MAVAEKSDGRPNDFPDQEGIETYGLVCVPCPVAHRPNDFPDQEGIET